MEGGSAVRVGLSGLVLLGSLSTGWACGARSELDGYGELTASDGVRDAPPPGDAALQDSRSDVATDAGREAQSRGDTGDEQRADRRQLDAGRDAGRDSAIADAGDASDAIRCAKACIPEEARCVAGGVARCVAGANGCGDWSPPLACGAHATCLAMGSRASCACNPGFVFIGGACAPSPDAIPAPRPLAPLSTATVTSQTPILRWALAPDSDGARVDVCGDRACTMSVVSFQVTATSGSVPSALAAGVHFWRLHGTNGGVAGTQTSPVWELFVGAASAPVNTAWGTTVDVNGDGFSDVIVGASDAVTLTGGAYVYLGGPGGLSAQATSIPPPRTGAAFGESVASAGDVNGDGFADVIIGSPTFGNSAYLYLGGPQGLGATPTTLTSPAIQFGYSVTSAGDVNGDGYADVIVGATGAGSVDGSLSVFLGGPGGLSTTPTTLVAAGAASVASAGDVNGDGFADVIVGTLGFAAGSFFGGADLYVGSAGGLSAPVALSPPATADQFGYSVASAGDVNGDGFADVIVGATGSGGSATSVYLFLGGAAGLSASSVSRLAPVLAASFVDVVAGGGDVDGDGFADVTVASYGRTGGIDAMPILIAGAQPAAHVSVAGAGDLNGDGFADILVGTIAPDGVSLYYGSATGPAVSPTPVLDQYPDVPYQTYFGFAVQ